VTPKRSWGRRGDTAEPELGASRCLISRRGGPPDGAGGCPAIDVLESEMAPWLVVRKMMSGPASGARLLRCWRMPSFELGR
jgi:hypothetical protein